EPFMNADAVEKMALSQDLRFAIERKELVLHYQSKHRADGRIAGAEALLRWQHPRHGLLGPDKFIGLAESNGLIVPIGAWVLQEACRQMKAWHDRGHGDWTIAVNVSPVQFA